MYVCMHIHACICFCVYLVCILQQYIIMCMHVHNGVFPYLAKPTCNALPPENGAVYVFPDGMSAVFTCNTNYTMVGNPFVHCIAGKWTHPSPTCELPSNI